MTIDKTIVAMLLIPVIGLAIPTAILCRKLPGASLTPTEKELVTFSSQSVTIAQPGRPAVFSGLECPLRPPAGKGVSTNGPASPSRPPSATIER
jgi:hypothetical protein